MRTRNSLWAGLLVVVAGCGDARGLVGDTLQPTLRLFILPRALSAADEEALLGAEIVAGERGRLPDTLCVRMDARLGRLRARVGGGGSSQSPEQSLILTSVARSRPRRAFADYRAGLAGTDTLVAELYADADCAPDATRAAPLARAALQVQVAAAAPPDQASPDGGVEGGQP